MKEVIYTAKAPRPVGPYSQAIKAGNFLFVSGQIPIDPSTNDVIRGDITIQTRRVLENIKVILNKAGYDLNDIVYVTVFLSDLNDFSQFNRVYAEYFKENPPARVTIEASRLPKDVRIEVSVIAYKE